MKNKILDLVCGGNAARVEEIVAQAWNVEILGDEALAEIKRVARVQGSCLYKAEDPANSTLYIRVQDKLHELPWSFPGDGDNWYEFPWAGEVERERNRAKARAMIL